MRVRSLLTGASDDENYLNFISVNFCRKSGHNNREANIRAERRRRFAQCHNRCAGNKQRVGMRFPEKGISTRGEAVSGVGAPRAIT